MTRLGVLLLTLGVLVAGCAERSVDTSSESRATTQAPQTNTVGPGGYRKVGTPYQIAGIWYHPKEDPAYDEIGMASWYGPNFHGRTTANGETYDQYAMTAAHPTLPMPSLVEVTNLANGRTIVLRINDRGPFAKGRIIDVSKAAAEELGFKKQGVTRVRVRVVEEDAGPRPEAAPVEAVAKNALPAQGGTSATQQAMVPKTAAAPSTDTSGQQLFLQAGAFRDYGNARRHADSLSGVGEPLIEAVSTAEEVIYRVRIGPMTDRGLAEKLRIALIDQGISNPHIVIE